LQRLGIRAYYYASTTGGEDVVGVVRNRLWNIGFHPVIFRKAKNRSATKGVDIALTTDLLSNAYRNNYDVAVLIAGDDDYVPLVEDVKRLGKLVHVAFLAEEGGGLSPELYLASDVFWPIDYLFMNSWQQYSPEDGR
jgi:uncharacterized LabA/DUF88 family protein